MSSNWNPRVAAPVADDAPLPSFSVVVPAHDEEAVIARCLDTLTRGALEGELEIVVVCNGCHDRTADRARATLPSATVLELEVASKAAALNAGDAHATRFPRFYVDADVELPVDALRATARMLAEPGIDCAAPTPFFDLAGRPRIVRDYYAVWQRLPYHRRNMVGTGVYALSESGRQRFDRFPDLTADDQFVLQQFAETERRSLPNVHFVVHPPTTLQGLVAIRRRAYRGAAELQASGLVREAPASGAGQALLAEAKSPAKWPAVTVYAMVSVYAKLLARWSRAQGWERDDSARRIPGTG